MIVFQTVAQYAPRTLPAHNITSHLPLRHSRGDMHQGSPACMRLGRGPLGQGASCSLAVSARAYAGVTAHMLEFPDHIEAPSTSARKHAEKYANNLHPVGAQAAASPT